MSASTQSSDPEPELNAWLALVAEKVKSMRFGIVQITVHDSRVVQVERTERTRFELPRSTSAS